MAASSGIWDEDWLETCKSDLFGVMEMFKSWIVIMVVQFCKLTKNHLVVQLKQVNFMIYVIYLNKAVLEQLLKMECKCQKLSLIICMV